MQQCTGIAQWFSTDAVSSMGAWIRMSAFDRRRQRAVLPLLVLLAVVGCDSHQSGSARVDADGVSALSFTPPLVVQSVREIDLGQLELFVLLNGSRIALERVGERWEGAAMVNSNQVATLQVTWQYLGLDVATATRTLPVAANATAASISFESDEFNTTADADDDGYSNLREFDASTDPNDRASPGATQSDVPLDIELSLPDTLQSASEAIREQIQVSASVNDRNVMLVRDSNDRWQASTTARAESDVFVVARVFATSDNQNELARLERSVTVGRGVDVSFGGDQYQTEFDDDLDGQTNLDALLAQAAGDPGTPSVPTGDPDTDDGSNPTPVTPPTEPDPAQPAEPTEPTAPTDPIEPTEPTEPDEPDTPSGDGCEISNFDSACDIDTDEDGVPDSEEGQAADADGDAIPDYLESDRVDADDDGTSAQEDVNDRDPCSPGHQCTSLRRSVSRYRW